MIVGVADSVTLIFVPTGTPVNFIFLFAFSLNVQVPFLLIVIRCPSASFTPPSVVASVPFGKVNVAVKSKSFSASTVPPFALIALVTFKEPSVA